MGTTTTISIATSTTNDLYTASQATFASFNSILIILVASGIAFAFARKLIAMFPKK